MLIISATVVRTQLAEEPGFPLCMATPTLESEDCFSKFKEFKRDVLLRVNGSPNYSMDQELAFIFL